MRSHVRGVGSVNRANATEPGEGNERRCRRRAGPVKMTTPRGGLVMPRLTVAALALALAGSAAAADLSLKNLQLGEILYGPPVTAEQLTGRVVLVEHWGIH